MSDIETRALDVRLQVTAGRTVRWRPIVFDRESGDLGGFTEIIAASAVTKTLQEGRAVADWQHQDGMIIGSVSAGTLRLTVDKGGVWAEAEIPRAREDVMEAIQRREANAGSFSFRMISEKWSSGNMPKRTILELQLFSVSLLASMPAYAATSGSVSIRTMIEAVEHRTLDGPPVVQLPVKHETVVRYAHPLTLAEARAELAQWEQRFNEPRVAAREDHPHEAVSSRTTYTAEDRAYRPLPPWKAWVPDTPRAPDTSAPAPMTLEAHRRALEAEARALTVEYASPPQSSPTSKRFWFW